MNRRRTENTCALIQLNHGVENQLITGFYSSNGIPLVHLDCVNNPCVYGTCSSSTTGYRCSCNIGFVGANCNIGKLSWKKKRKQKQHYTIKTAPSRYLSIDSRTIPSIFFKMNN